LVSFVRFASEVAPHSPPPRFFPIVCVGHQFPPIFRKASIQWFACSISRESRVLPKRTLRVLVRFPRIPRKNCAPPYRASAFFSCTFFSFLRRFCENGFSVYFAPPKPGTLPFRCVVDRRRDPVPFPKLSTPRVLPHVLDVHSLSVLSFSVCI